jgi:hypothetical protein
MYTVRRMAVGAVLCLISITWFAGPATADNRSPITWGKRVPVLGSTVQSGVSAVACDGAWCVVAEETMVKATPNAFGQRPVWESLAPSPSTVTSIACAEPSRCVAVSGDSEILTLTAREDTRSSWKRTSVAAAGLTSVSCVPSGLCVAVGTNGSVATSANAFASKANWTSTTVQTAVPGICDKLLTGPGCAAQLTGVSCAAGGFCLATDDVNNGDAGSEGEVLTTNHPAEGDSWRRVLVSTSYGLATPSCPSAHLCIVSDDRQLFMSTRPSANSATWVVAQQLQGVTGLSCASRALCGAGTYYALASSTSPTARTAWFRTPAEFGQDNIDAVACVVREGCLAATVEGEIITGRLGDRGAPAQASGNDATSARG